MSIVCTEVESEICEQVSYNGTSKFVRATIDPATKHQLNLPADYKYHSVFMPRKYIDWAERYQNFGIREDDVWIAGFAKTGTTWLHNIVRQLKCGLNFNEPARRSGDEFIDFLLLFEESNGNKTFQQMIDRCDDQFENYEKKPSPRIFKTHLPPFLAPKAIWTIKPKVIYIARNPKDAIVSLYYMHRNDNVHYTGTLEGYCDKFMKNQMVFTPFFDNILSYWQLKHLDHVLFVTYEELSADLFAGVKRISEFLECSYTDEELKELAEYVSFKKMRESMEDNLPNELNGKKQDPDYRYSSDSNLFRIFCDIFQFFFPI